MNLVYRLCVSALFLCTAAPLIQAAVSRSDAELSRQFEHAVAVFEGKVLAVDSFISGSGNIETRFTVRVDQPYKGNVSSVVTLTLPGGAVGNQAEAVGCQPQLKVGEDRLFLLAESADGALYPVAGCASAVKRGYPGFVQALSEVSILSLTSPAAAAQVAPLDGATPLAETEEEAPEAASSSATNLITYAGLGARFLQPDRGDTIPYLVDADYLPAGITLNEALGAVSNALVAWEAVSSVAFSYQGLQSFGQAASSPALPSDGTLRIQLHDFYNAISGSTTLGIGGRSHNTLVLTSDWASGGQVFGNDFHGTTRGYVVLKHTKTAMQTLSTFEEVLCHEIGHALTMDHSTPDTPAAVGSSAWEAQMYYIAHEDGRGASPTAWDSNVLNQVHPTANTPPYMFTRVMDITTHWAGAPAVPGINEIQLTAYDLQTTNLSIAVADSNADSGIFALTNDNTLRYTPDGFFSGPRVDPSTGASYERIYARCSDGTHASAFQRVKVVSFNLDYEPSISDGIPDDWMTANGWDPDPTIGTDHGADDDKDGDTLTNIDEYRAWMDATNGVSAQLLSAASDGTVSWQGKAYELYELQCSTNLTDWFFVKAVLPTNDTPSVNVDPASYASAVYRVFKVK